MSYENKILCVDFDGTLNEYEPGSGQFPNIGSPKKKIIEGVKILKKKGWKIILWTCRWGKDLQDAIEWCDKFGLEFDAVNENLNEVKQWERSPKPYCTRFLDDKNITLEQFEQWFEQRVKMKEIREDDLSLQDLWKFMSDKEKAQKQKQYQKLSKNQKKKLKKQWHKQIATEPQKPKEPSRKGAIIPFFVEKDGKIRMMFMISSDETFGGVCWQIAKGGIDRGETPLKAAMREGNEEIGLRKSNIEQMYSLGKMKLFGQEWHLFICEVKNKKAFDSTGPETQQVKWMTIKEFMSRGRKRHQPIVMSAYKSIKKLNPQSE